MQTFLKQVDANKQVTANDVSIALNTLLESSQTGPIQEDSKQQFEFDKLEEQAQENFWVAYTGLEDKLILFKGIETSIEIQQAIVSKGTSLLEQKQIRVCNDFRYLFMDSHSLSNAKFLLNPVALRRLAIFINETYKMTRTKAKDKPFIIAARNPTTNNVLVLAVEGSKSLSGEGRNSFGTRFRNAAEQIQAKIKQTSLESSIIEISNNDWKPFIDVLVQ